MTGAATVDAFHLALAWPSWFDSQGQACAPLPKARALQSAIAAELPPDASLLRWAVVAIAREEAKDRVTLKIEGAYRRERTPSARPPVAIR